MLQLAFDYSDLQPTDRETVQQYTVEIKALMRRAAQDIVEIGHRLIEVKARLGHGSFGAWLSSEFDWSLPTALRFMQVTQQFKNVNLTDLEMAPSALYLLAAPSTPEPARQEAIGRAEAGEQITYSAAREIVAEHKTQVSPQHEQSDLSTYRPVLINAVGYQQPQQEYQPAEAATVELGTVYPGTLDYSGRQKPKVNRAGDIDEPRGFDVCQTPGYAIDPLLPYLPADWIVWEPACGERIMVEAFYDAGFQVTGSDVAEGQNFFEYTAPQWDVLITNPPYSIKYQWLERCYTLGRPFALLLPVETLGAQRAQNLFIAHGVQIILLDKRINFKMPNIGWEGSSAQFPVAWFTWGLNLDSQIVFGKLP